MVGNRSSSSLKTRFNQLLDCLYPHICIGCGEIGTALCERCMQGCAQELRVLTVDWGVVESGYSYDYPLIQQVVHALKEQGLPRAAAELVARCGYSLKPGTCFIPVPIARKRLVARGYNQSEVLAMELAGQCNGFVARHALIRVGSSQQRGKARNERLAANLSIRRGLPIPHAAPEYVLVDDVITTGTTLATCAQLLQEGGIKVSRGVTLAFAP
jgi:ComF family protein